MSNWNKRIRAAREAQKMTREMVVQKMQQFLPESEKAVTTRSLISWEAGEREPRVTVGVALAKALGFEDVADLYLDSEPKLNQVGQQRLGEYRSMLLHTAEFTEKPEPTLRLLPVYLQPASAGTGQWLDDDAQEMTEVDESVPAKAEFGVRIAGDSMEPRFVNGQTVWVKAAQDANNGDIVLCTLNDQAYCKKLRKDKNGIALISLNKKYAPIPVREEDEFRIAGIVVRKERRVCVDGISFLPMSIKRFARSCAMHSAAAREMNSISQWQEIFAPRRWHQCWFHAGRRSWASSSNGGCPVFAADSKSSMPAPKR